MADDKQKSPLDILEDVLEDAKGAAQAKKAADTAEEEKKQQAELAALKAQRKIEEEALIEDQLAKMKEITQSPAEKSRLAQEQAGVDADKQEKSSHEGFEIRQLGHTKV